MAGRPKKATPAQWSKARAMYEAGKSSRQIDTELGINYKSIQEMAKKEDWQKGILSQQIEDLTRVETNFFSISSQQQEIVRQEVDIRLKHIKFFNDLAIKNVKQSMTAECDNQNDFKSRADTILKSRETVLGKTPDTAININTAVKVETPTGNALDWLDEITRDINAISV